MTIHLSASTSIISPSFMMLVICFMPTTLGIPNSRETTDTCPVIPPSSATIAAAFFIMGTKSGDVFITMSMSHCSILWKSRVQSMIFALPVPCHLQAILPENSFCSLFVLRYFCMKSCAFLPMMSSGSHFSL